MKDKNEETTTASRPARWHREDARFKGREEKKERRKRGRRGRKITNAHTHTQTTGTIFLEGEGGKEGKRRREEKEEVEGGKKEERRRGEKEEEEEGKQE